MDAKAKSLPQPLKPGVYCRKEALTGFTGTGKNISLGYFLMLVHVKQRGDAYSITFSNSMPDSQEILTGDTDKARVLRDGSLAFEFTDGWENLGRARVYPTGKVVLTLIKEAPVNQIGRNYGTFTVSRAQCQAKEFRP